MENQSIKKACLAVGGLTKLAALLGVRPPTVSQWQSGIRPVPVERCADIERVTAGLVTRKDLRPDDWQKIWPELAQKEQKQEVA